MPKFIATHAVNNVDHWKAQDAHRTEVFKSFATDVTSYVDTNGSKTVALSMNVHDLAGLQSFMKSPAGAAAMKRDGVVEPVTFFAA